MFLGKVIGQAESDESAGEEANSRLKVVQKLDLYRNATGPSTVVVDFVGADSGDIVMVGPPSATATSGPQPLSNSMRPETTDSMIMCILNSKSRHRNNRQTGT